jgi:hypothetical protein
VVQALHLAAECRDVVILAVKVRLQPAAQLSLAAGSGSSSTSK